MIQAFTLPTAMESKDSHITLKHSYPPNGNPLSKPLLYALNKWLCFSLTTEPAFESVGF